MPGVYFFLPQQSVENNAADDPFIPSGYLPAKEP